MELETFTTTKQRATHSSIERSSQAVTSVQTKTIESDSVYNYQTRCKWSRGKRLLRFHRRGVSVAPLCQRDDTLDQCAKMVSVAIHQDKHHM